MASEQLRIGASYETTCGTLWKDGTYFPRGTVVEVVGLHLDQGFCVRYPAQVDGEPLETWEAWSESGFVAAQGSVEPAPPLSRALLAQARSVLRKAEDGAHLHLHEEERSE